MALLLLATLASFVASLVLGTRLLRQAARTRQIPEFSIGASFILGGVIGFLLLVIANPVNDQLDPELMYRFLGWGLLFINLAVACLYVFIWRAFHPTARWAMWLAIAGSLVAVGTSVTVLLAASMGQNSLVYWGGSVARLGSGAWGAVEALRWWRMLRRRLALGLADPVVTNRFLLWGLACAGTFVVLINGLAPQEEGNPLSPISILMVSLFTVFVAVNQWLAFFPSRGYLGWIRRRAEAKYPVITAT